VEKWLPLNDYANQHQISVSTLRRRIKTNKIKYKLEDGKYFIVEDSPVSAAPVEKPVTSHKKTEGVVAASVDTLGTTRLLLDELKRAYLESLQSKEDQILYLKQQVSDLKTLVMLLEKDNSRLKNKVDDI
jgi:predicted site-specific integrase-resolvase